MFNTVDERDFRLLSNDKYTFSVLSRVLRGPCTALFTDHERLIVCYTAAPYPVWFWTPDDASDSEKENAWQLAAKTFPLSDGFRYNLKYDLAEYFIARAQETGLTARISTNLFAYDCPAAIAPAAPVCGSFYECTPEDVNEAADLLLRFHEDIKDGSLIREQCLKKAGQLIEDKSFFFWKDDSGRAVSCCSLRPDSGLGCISSVYTLPEFRRRHFAQHMVYQLTRRTAALGLMPMLYTDADYAASNACYEKIGYILRGKLCTLSAR